MEERQDDSPHIEDVFRMKESSQADTKTKAKPKLIHHYLLRHISDKGYTLLLVHLSV